MPIILLSLANASFGAELPETLPLPKTGACPSGYMPNGSFCMPSKNANYAIAKKDVCPTGYFPNGDYCIANKNSKTAIPKTGTCPTGWFPNGDYCVKSSH